MIDVGAGTMDVLYYDDRSGIHYKAIVKSPVQYVCERAAQLRGSILITGREMGGGALARVLGKHAETAEVVMTRSSALTLSHDSARVQSLGIRIIEDDAAQSMAALKSHSHFVLGDLQKGHLEQIVQDLGVPFEFDIAAVCAQDHGMPPEGVSHLDYRHNLFKERLDRQPFPHTLLYAADEVPQTFNRLRSIVEDAKAFLPAGRVYVMDSGMAAIQGASMDFEARKRRNIVVRDVATSHTVGAALADGEIAGFFEYHTSDITAVRLDSLIGELVEGTLDHETILREGGHGAYIRRKVGMDSLETIVATGPKRRLIANSKLPVSYGAPLGDNMMTGTVGLLEAVRRREGMESITYL